MKFERTFLLLVWLVWAAPVRSEDFTSLCADRTALERVYYNHRIGEKPPFEQVLPPDTLAKLIRKDLEKEATLQKVYGVKITPAMLDAEVERINTTTRAPEMLVEIKTALGNDPARFANIFAKPILVERLLREKFDNDDALHAPQRGQAEQMRAELLNARTNSADYEKLLALLRRNHSHEVTEMMWQLGARPAETNAPAVDESEIKKHFGSNAQIITPPPAGGREAKLYFEDLPVPLQEVLRVQLQHSGDVSAVIEMPGGFLLYVAQARHEDTLSVATLAIPKRSYESWLSEQNENKP